MGEWVPASGVRALLLAFGSLSRRPLASRGHSCPACGSAGSSRGLPGGFLRPEVASVVSVGLPWAGVPLQVTQAALPFTPAKRRWCSRIPFPSC